MSLIEGILAASRARLDARKKMRPLSDVRAMASGAGRAATGFRVAIESRAFSLIAEVKRRSPSSGGMDPSNVANAIPIYDAAASVAAISIVTDEDHFGGSLEELGQARSRTDKPLLRKDFIVDEYQVWEARAHGADAILIMSGLHSEEPRRAADLIGLARSMEMDVLFELGMSSEDLAKQQELIPSDAVIWGVNARRFKTSALRLMSRLGSAIGKELSTDTDVHRALRTAIPAGQTAVAESGISDPRYIRELIEMKYAAALIGTAFLKKGANVSDVVRAFDDEVAALQPRRPGLPDLSVNSP